MLETKNPSDEWPAEETEGLTLTVIKLNEQTLELEPALTVSLADASTATLAQLKAALEEKVMHASFRHHCPLATRARVHPLNALLRMQAGIRSDAQRLLRVCNSDVEFIEGSAESTLVNDCKLSDGSLVYVEELKVQPTTAFHLCFSRGQEATWGEKRVAHPSWCAVVAGGRIESAEAAVRSGAKHDRAQLQQSQHRRGRYQDCHRPTRDHWHAQEANR